ncbi:MAG: hypothetical protein LBD30_06770 [Verrucomicrobiales bacterium]|nr:hypothetical protein [Verrucomicrobiales bacterium]
MVKKINALTVSHAPTRHIQGGLHAETSLGPTSNPNEFIVHRPLNKITVKNSSEIRDEKVRVLVQECLTAADGALKKNVCQTALSLRRKNAHSQSARGVELQSRFFVWLATGKTALPLL